MPGRREFLGRAAASLSALAAPRVAASHSTMLAASDWDFTWTTRLAQKHKTVFDVAVIESGFGVFRAAIWESQCIEFLRAATSEVSPVIVLRAHAVALALQQSFWDHYAIGRHLRVTHPVTLKRTGRNPVLMTASDGLSEQLVRGTLSAQLSRGVTVLACNLALKTWVAAVGASPGVTEAEAKERVIAALLPGVIVQPSGVLALGFAQEHGCSYIRAS